MQNQNFLNNLQEQKKVKKQSQMQKLVNSQTINVAIVNNDAYWVHDNIFYVTTIDDEGRIEIENAKPIDVFSLSEKETTSLLKILDSLKES